jgi:hypothetical protein
VLEGRRVDYALCYPASKPVAFVEVKQVGQSEGAERQLFEYAFHRGIPLAILTDGQEWNFFLPAEQGHYSERRVYKLDLLEREPAEAVSRFERYLGYAQVASGNALQAARDDYRSVSRERLMTATLPEAWSKLVAEEDDLLLELVADKVESLCGFKPTVDAVARFLQNWSALRRPTTKEASSVQRTASPPAPIAVAARKAEAQTASAPASSARVGYSLEGKFSACRSGKEVLTSVFEVFALRDSTFLDRFASRPKHGRKRRYLARVPDELYPDRPDLAREHSHRLSSGWYVGTNVSHAQIEHIISMACEVAGVTYGQDLKVFVGD